MPYRMIGCASPFHWSVVIIVYVVFHLIWRTRTGILAHRAGQPPMPVRVRQAESAPGPPAPTGQPRRSRAELNGPKSSEFFKRPARRWSSRKGSEARNHLGRNRSRAIPKQPPQKQPSQANKSRRRPRRSNRAVVPSAEQRRASARQRQGSAVAKTPGRVRLLSERSNIISMQAASKDDACRLSHPKQMVEQDICEKLQPFGRKVGTLGDGQSSGTRTGDRGDPLRRPTIRRTGPNPSCKSWPWLRDPQMLRKPSSCKKSLRPLTCRS